jgi:hypothetical protein
MSAEIIRLGHIVASSISHVSLQTVAGVGLVIWKAASRVDHLFESSKLRLAEAFRNIGLLWAECEIGRMKKFALLINHYGLSRTVRGLLGVGTDGWTFERRINRGTWRNRAVQSGELRQRRFDDPGIVMLVSRVVAD